MMAANRWRFFDPVTSDAYTFEMSPNEGGTPAFGKTTTQQSTAAPGGATLLFEGQDAPQQFDFAGVILYESQYTAMVEWFSKRYTIQVTDDLGRTFDIYITNFDPKRKRSANHPWKHEYSVKAQVIR